MSTLNEVGTDALKWSEWFLETFENNPEKIFDDGVMLSWFANAIMAGHDEARRQYEMVNRHEMIMAMIEGFSDRPRTD